MVVVARWISIQRQPRRGNQSIFLVKMEEHGEQDIDRRLECKSSSSGTFLGKGATTKRPVANGQRMQDGDKKKTVSLMACNQTMKSFGSRDCGISKGCESVGGGMCLSRKKGEIAPAYCFPDVS